MSGPNYSEDGQWMWDGNDWVPVGQPNVPINNAVNQYAPTNTNYQMAPQSNEQVVVYSSPESSSGKPVIIVVSIVVGIALVIILAGVLYVWASSLSEEEVEGKWYDDEGEWIELTSDGKFKCSESCGFDEWRIGENSGEIGFCEDDSNSEGGGCDESYYYIYEYEVKGDVMYLARHDTGGNPGNCIALVKSGNSYNDAVNSESSPSWCDL